MTDLELQRKSLPNEPGVYLFKDKDDVVIYIGKAINLKKRVSSYFLKTKYSDVYYEEKIRNMVKEIASLEYFVTENEKEAYILENIQIKSYGPKYNVRMRDSKTYPWIIIFYTEEFPRIHIIRGPEKYSQKNLFLGPYTDRKEISRILRDLRKIFPYCACKNKVSKKREPCIYFQLKLCPGPCIGAITKEEYYQNIKKIEYFLKGETDELSLLLKKRMAEAAENQDYEAAAFWRDKLEAIEKSTTSQNVLLDHKENKDIIGYSINDKYAAFTFIQIRDGRIRNKSSFNFDLREKIILKEEILPSVLEQYYQDLKSNLPEVIIVPEIFNDLDILIEILRDLKNDIQIRTPFHQEKGLVRIAKKNAKVIVDQLIEMEELRQLEDNQIQKALEEAKELLDLPNVPRIIEGFDISNIEGQDATGSMVYFLEGHPYNKYYRHYNIKSKSTPDDVAMMKEVIKRRYMGLLEKGWELPDLILVDGGKGQLNAGVSVLKELGLDIPIIGLAKKFEEIFIPGEKEPIILNRNSMLLKIFQRVRDEAHRFAVKLHKKQRQKRVVGSALDNIKGVGNATRNKLLKHFGSLQGVKEASVEELNKVVNKKLAETIKKELN